MLLIASFAYQPSGIRPDRSQRSTVAPEHSISEGFSWSYHFHKSRYADAYVAVALDATHMPLEVLVVEQHRRCMSQTDDCARRTRIKW
jgi:hypothetical protein